MNIMALFILFLAEISFFFCDEPAMSNRLRGKFNRNRSRDRSRDRSRVLGCAALLLISLALDCFAPVRRCTARCTVVPSLPPPLPSPNLSAGRQCRARALPVFDQFLIDSRVSIPSADTIRPIAPEIYFEGLFLPNLGLQGHLITQQR